MLKQYFWPVVVGVLLVFASSYLGADYKIFDLVPNLDKLFHITGGVIAGWLVVIFYAKELQTMTRTKRLLMVLGGVCLIGLLWEWFEFVMGMFDFRYFPGIGSLEDTLGDFLADLLGALLVVLVRR
jgi:VanZ family protein